MDATTLASRAVRGAFTAAGAVVTGPARIAGRLGRTLVHIEEMATGMSSMTGDVGRMREGVETLGEQVEGLRGDVQGLYGDVGGIREATQTLDERVDALGESLVAVDALATRLGFLAGRRSRTARRAGDDAA